MNTKIKNNENDFVEKIENRKQFKVFSLFYSLYNQIQFYFLYLYQSLRNIIKRNFKNNLNAFLKNFYFYFYFHTQNKSFKTLPNRPY